MKNMTIIVALVMLIATVKRLHASDVRVMVLDFTSNISRHQAENARNRILLRLINNTSVTVIEPDRHLINNYIHQAKTTYKDSSRAASIGRLHNADYVIYGTLDRDSIDKTYIVYVRVVNSFTGAVVYAGAQSYTVKKEIYTAADGLSKKLIQKLKSYRPARYSAKKVTFSCDSWVSYFQPLATLNNHIGSGGSFTCVIGANIHQFIIGLRTGISIVNGKGPKNYALIAPMQLHLGYSFNLYSSFFLMFTASGGLVYKYLSAKTADIQGFSAMVSLALVPGYTFSEHISLIVPIETVCIIEGKDDLWGISAGIGIQYRY